MLGEAGLEIGKERPEERKDMLSICWVWCLLWTLVPRTSLVQSGSCWLLAPSHMTYLPGRARVWCPTLPWLQGTSEPGTTSWILVHHILPWSPQHWPPKANTWQALNTVAGMLGSAYLALRTGWPLSPGSKITMPHFLCLVSLLSTHHHHSVAIRGKKR